MFVTEFISAGGTSNKHSTFSFAGGKAVIEFVTQHVYGSLTTKVQFAGDGTSCSYVALTSIEKLLADHSPAAKVLQSAPGT